MKQHIISKCYLKAWCDPLAPSEYEPYLWLISRDGKEKRKRAPQKSLTKTDAFTLTLANGARDLRVETTLSKLETQFVGVRRKISAKTTLSGLDKAHLAAFMATMSSRADPYADNLESFFLRLHERVKHLEEVGAFVGPMQLPPPMPSEVGAPISSKDTSKLIRNSRAIGVVSTLDVAAPALWAMHLAFAEAPQGSFFITSDNPCVWFDPTAYRRPPFDRGVGLAMPEVEVTMPVSPKFLAVVTHNPEIPTYHKLNDAQVQELNRRTVHFCRKQFVSCSPETRSVWFEIGTPPPDAWDLQQRSE